MAFGNSTMN